MATMLEVPRSVTGIGLSGGTDSRILLAAALAVDPERKIRINSRVSAERDFAIASELARQFHFDLNRSSNGAIVYSHQDQVAQWVLSCAGIYDPLYSQRKKPQNITLFSVADHGPELYKGNYGWRSVDDVSQDVRAGQAHFHARMAEGLAAMDIDPEDPWGSEWHYVGFRNALHGGRSTMTSLVGIKPLFHRSLVGLSRSPLNEHPAPRKGRPSIASDLLIAISPELARVPFDDPAKNLRSSYVDEKARRFGRVDKAEPYTIIGSPEDMMAGPPAKFTDLAARDGLTGAFTVERVSELIHRVMPAIPPRPEEALLPVIKEAFSLAKISTDNRQSKAAGKLLAFLAVA